MNQYNWYKSLEPSHSFEEGSIPSPRDYTAESSWAALPGTSDYSDVVISHNSPSQTESSNTGNVDVFYVHPTTYFSPSSWNQPLSDIESEERLKNWVLLNQASVFNSCCEVYVPKYRQATLFSVISDHEDGDRAMDVAYTDVVRAFENFLNTKNKGRPFIIASHSQGSWHALRLIEEHLVGTQDLSRMVAAYLVGFPMPLDKFSRTLEGISLCTEPSQTGCIVTWNTTSDAADNSFYHKYARVIYGTEYEVNEGKSLVCVNPITWRVDGLPALAELNLGAVGFNLQYTTNISPQKALVGAQCIDGILQIPDIEHPSFSWFLFGEGNYHMHDYDLFYMNIRENLYDRIRSYDKQNQLVR